MSADDPLANLRALGVHTGGDLARRFYSEKRRRASECFVCGASLDGAEVWRVRIWIGHGNAIAPLCSECGPKDWRVSRRVHRLPPPRPCEGCGRPVVETEDRYQRRYVVCSEECRALAYQSTRRAERADARGERTCPVCGRTFAPRRSDGVYCSSACRQRAYRAREDAERRSGSPEGT
jgi:predicted nucleic acid-binding Zn ribbon protein